MIAGILLIISGLLVALYPPILSIIVAVVLICLGMVSVVTAYRFRQQTPQRSIDVIEFIFRH